MLGSVLMFGCVLAAQVDAAGNELKLEVRRLVRQLDASQLVEREEAEKGLLELGPKVLDLLPRLTERTPAEVRLRLGRVRQKLQQIAAKDAAKTSLVTLQGDAMPLSKVLAAIEEQTGNKIVDYRARFGHEVTDPELKVDFDQTPFWKALDETLDQAKLTAYQFGQQRAINVVGRDEGQLPRCVRASYTGPFRIEPLMIVAQRDLRDPAAQWMRLKMEIAWEPRLSPISLKQKMADLEAVSDRGGALPVDDRQAEVEVPIDGDATAVNLIVPWKLPPRDVHKIARLSGKLTAMIQGKIETFTFDDLPRAKNVERRIAGVTVTLEQVRKNNELQEVRIRVRFDEAAGALASYRGWIFNNEAHLIGPDGKPIEYETLETTRQTSSEIGVAYLFFIDGPLDNHKFVYKTPGVIVASEFEYQVEDVELP